MPQLRSGARRSKRLGDSQPPPQPVEQAENFLLPTQNRTRRRAGAGRGRGSNAAVTNGPAVAIPGRPTYAGGGRGVRLIDLDPEPPCQGLPQPIIGGAAGEHIFNRVEGGAEKDIAMEGASGDKILGVEEDTSTAPVPERVCFNCVQ